MPDVIKAAKTLFEKAAQPVCIVDNNLKVVWYNEATRQELQVLCSPDGLLSVIPDEAVELAKKNLAQKQEAVLSGENIPMLLSTIRLVPLGDEQDYAIAHITLSRSPAGSIYPKDVCGRFSATFERQFRVPTSIIFSTLDVLHRRGSQDDELLGHIAQQSYQILRTNLLLSEYMKYTYGINPLNKKITDINELLENIVSEVKIFLPEGAKISYEFIGDICNTSIDAEKMHILIASLLDNSCKFKGEKPLEIELGCTVDEKQIILHIRDNGKGIPETVQPYVFEPFYSYTSETMPFAANGLGLTLCKLIARQHNGIMLLYSKVGEGTVVTVKIPRDDTGNNELMLKDGVLAGSYYKRFSPFSLIMMGSKPKLPEKIMWNK